MNTLEEAALHLADLRLVCVLCPTSSPLRPTTEVLVILRPLSVDGTLFPGDWSSYGGASSTTMRVNAPPAELWLKRSRRSKKWVVDISVPAVPGPGPVYFHEEFSTLDAAVEAITECYFGNRVDFANESLRAWN